MYLGLDLGTSGLRALLIDEAGQPIGAAETHYAAVHPYPGWSEQDPADWTAAVVQTVAELKERFPQEIASLIGIGISGHMHGAVLLDDAGSVLRPCILWNDTRSHAEAEELDSTAGVRNLSGNIVFPGFTAPKLMWVARHEPQVFERVAKVLLPKDYLNFWLTGLLRGDLSDASGTSWLDVGGQGWSESLLEASGMSRSQMSELVVGTAALGKVETRRAAHLGLPKGVVVAGGGADNAAAACGVGTLKEGQGFVSLGTSGVLLAARERYVPMPASAVHTFCHAVPDTWYQMGVILAATDSLNWLARVFEQDAPALTAALGDQITAPGDVRFMPYLSGERTPHNDAKIRGAFLNLDIGTERNDMVRAVLEGVSFALRDSLEALKSTGANLSRVTAIGGGAQSPYWVELLATVLNLPVDLPAKGEFGAALGAARLAICAVSGADPKEVMTPPEVRQTIQPRADMAADYDAAWKLYRGGYPALRATMPV